MNKSGEQIKITFPRITPRIHIIIWFLIILAINSCSTIPDIQATSSPTTINALETVSKFQIPPTQTPSDDQATPTATQSVPTSNAALSPSPTITPTITATETITTPIAKFNIQLVNRLDLSAIGEISQVTWSPFGDTYAVSTSGGGVIIDLESAEILHELNQGAPLSSLAFSPDGQLLVFGSLNSQITIWDATTAEFLGTFNGHLLGISSLEFIPGTDLLLSGGDDGTIRIWDTSIIDGESTDITNALAVFNEPVYSALDISTAPFDMLFSVSSYQAIHTWAYLPGGEIDESSFEILSSRSTISGWVNVVAYHPFSPIFASAGDDMRITFWDNDSGERILTHSTRIGSPILSLDFFVNGTLLAVGSTDGTIQFWDFPFLSILDNEGAAVADLFSSYRAHASKVVGIDFQPLGNHMLSVSNGGAIAVWLIEENIVDD